MSNTATQSDPAFIGNLPWLDFVNTERVEDGSSLDLVKDFQMLVAWCTRAELVGPEERDEILRRWEGSAEAEQVVREALALRAALRCMAERLAASDPAPDDAVQSINRVLRTEEGYPRIVQAGGGYERVWEIPEAGPVRLLHGIADSAAEFLIRGNPALVKRCDHPACILYFYDTTKNRGRRYCSTATCGNRARVAAHYRRKRGTSQRSRTE